MPAESKQLAEWQDLFELYVSDYLQLQRCSEELLYLKALWDMVGALMYIFADWCVMGNDMQGTCCCSSKHLWMALCCSTYHA